MAVHSRRSTDQLLMPNEKPDLQSTLIWPDQPKYGSVIDAGTVPVVYYLSRNGQLDHPHFIRVPLSSSQGLFLRDVLDKLNLVRGNGMPYMYSWSSKRSYKNGYVWQDLADYDLIQPTSDHDYILKGSEILPASITIRSLHQTAANEPYDPSAHRSGGKPRKKNQSWSTFENPKNNGIHDCRLVCKSESSRELGGAKAWADMATQTEVAGGRFRRCKSVPEDVHVNSSVELSREDLAPTSMSSSDRLDGVSGSGDVDRCGNVLNLTVGNECTKGRIKPSRVLMHLISCGSTATVPLKKRSVAIQFQ